MAIRTKQGFSLGLSLLGASALTPVALVARAEIYLSPEQAVQEIFPPGPGAASKRVPFERSELIIPDDKAKQIEQTTGQSVRSKKLVVFKDQNKNLVFIDQVLGKHEMITYAVGVNSDGTVKDIEILEYRETYGQAVKTPEWRKQFVGKGPKSDLKVGSDIKNISGATLSSAHVTAGVKRLVATYELMRASL